MVIYNPWWGILTIDKDPDRLREIRIDGDPYWKERLRMYGGELIAGPYVFEGELGDAETLAIVWFPAPPPDWGLPLPYVVIA